MFRISLALLALISVRLAAGVDPHVAYQPVHEAFIVKITALAPIEVLAKAPPSLKAESMPASPAPNMVWIPGYWSWNQALQEFQWVCGIWRLPPENHSWVSGYWKQDNGWYWVPGYWALSGLLPIYAQTPPPNIPRENPGNPPTKDSFFAPGYWNYQHDTFAWLGGSWQSFDPNFIYVPAHWQYHPEGYLFIPAFWDWKLEDRGIVYDCDGQSVFTPVATDVVISRLYYAYPDYQLFFWFHWHCCPDFWSSCRCTPPWWGWSSWWILGFDDSWALWWWWGHPGFPAPPWMADTLFDQMMGPDETALQFFKQAPMPLFLSPHGPLSFRDWLNAIGNKSPLVLQSDLENIRKKIEQNMPKGNTNARPQGPSNAGDVSLPSLGETIKPMGLAPLPGRPSQTAPVPAKPESAAPPVTKVPPRAAHPLRPASWQSPERNFHPASPRHRRPIRQLEDQINSNTRSIPNERGKADSS